MEASNGQGVPEPEADQALAGTPDVSIDTADMSPEDGDDWGDINLVNKTRQRQSGTVQSIQPRIR